MSRGKEAFIPISERGLRVSLNEKRYGAFRLLIKERGIQELCKSCAFDCVVLASSHKGDSSFRCFKYLRRIG